MVKHNSSIFKGLIYCKVIIGIEVECSLLIYFKYEKNVTEKTQVLVKLRFQLFSNKVCICVNI